MTENKIISEMIKELEENLNEFKKMTNSGNYSGAIDKAKTIIGKIKNIKSEIGSLQISEKIKREGHQETILGEIE